MLHEFPYLVCHGLSPPAIRYADLASSICGWSTLDINAEATSLISQEALCRVHPTMLEVIRMVGSILTWGNLQQVGMVNTWSALYVDAVATSEIQKIP